VLAAIMNVLTAGLAAGLTVGVLAGPAAADGFASARDDEPAGPPSAAGEHADHQGQFAIGLQVPVGIRAIAPYDGEYCGSRGENENVNAEVCIGRTPATLDFELAYGVKRNLELLLELRLGLERDFGMDVASDGDGPRLFRWSPGVKFYFAEAAVSKLFSTVQVAFDHTGYDNSDVGVDYFFRNVNGLQFDVHPSYGFYVYVGEELAFRRWFWLGVEAGIGIQGRYP
jgi:hypothetical protein